LTLSIDGNDIVLGMGGSDSVRFDFSYTPSRPSITLQIIGTDIRTYDFNDIIASFEEVNAQGTSASWSMQTALDANLISTSADHAIGGELAYRYARDGDLDALPSASIQSILSHPNFGVSAQPVEIDDLEEPLNTAPVVNAAIGDQVLSEDSSFTIQVPGDVFIDADAGDQLNLSAALGDGSALPAWLHFDADTGTFSGTPDNAAVGTFNIAVTAVDRAGLTAQASFNLSINNVNDVPVAQAIEGAAATQGQSFSFTVPEGTFVDVDAGDTLTYSATLSNGDALPDWLSFDAATRTFSGITGNGNVGEIHVKVTAVDGSGGTASSDFAIAVANVNDAPAIVYPIADQAALEDAVFSFTVPADAFNDIDVGDNLTYSATLANGDPLPSWLTFDPGTRTISGTPGADQVGSLSIRIAATDTSGLSASDTFDLKVATLNRTLTGTSGADILVGGAGNDTITDSNGSDTIDGGDGDDVISDGGSGTNMLRGGDGNDVITFSAVANNMIEGGAGNDLLKMDALNGSSLLYANTFAGGTGNDRMESAGSTDTYLFNRGDGQDVISDDDRFYYQKLDKLVFGEGIAATDVTVTRSGNDLMLKINDPGNPGASDEIKIENWDTIWYRIEQVEFVDGTTWSAAQLSEWAMAATDEADTLALWSDGGVVDGKGGNDTINFSSLNTSIAPTTIYGGDGNDSINTYSSGNNSSTFTVDGGAGDDTITDVGEMGIRRTLLGGDGNDVITFSCLGYSGNYAINGGAGNDWIKADGYLTSTGTYRWVNTLTGGAGDDRIESGRSADTYLFNRGDGQDVIRDYNNSSFDTVDKVVFGAGIMVNDVTAARSGNDLILKVNNPGNPAASDQITIENWDIGDAYRIEQVVFADGTVLTKDQVHAMALTVTGTDASDTINGWSENNIVYGMDGNDNITDAGGNDLLNGGMGSDTLDGGAGNDLFIGASGDDLIVTGAGADIIAFNRGDGQDVIAASTGKDNTLSLGHGILYVDLLFQKDNNDLALQTGASEQLIFKDWYASVNNHSVANLQMVIEGTADYEAASANQLNKKKVQQFNFDGLVAKFDSARSADPSLTSWSLSSSLLEFHLNGSSDTAALGGDLAYQYARNGNLSAISASPAQAIMASTQFGTANQNLQSSSALQDLTPRLM
jgi:Ca2+-binding RTX toxin-like protein